MIKTFLQTLLEKDYMVDSLHKTVQTLLLKYDNDQLYYKLLGGLKISTNLVLYYYIGVGFRCFNDNINTIGRNPVCNVIERNLNHELKKS